MSSSDLMFLKDSAVDFGVYNLYINGREVTFGSSNNRVCININSDFTYEFFVYKAVEGGSPVRENSDGLEDYVKSHMDNEVLFGVDFTGWFPPAMIGSSRSTRIKTNSALKMMFYETLPYHLLKRRFTDATNRNTKIKGQGDTQVLDTFQLNIIQNDFRARGFISYIQMMENSTRRKKIIDFRGINQIPRMFIPVYAQVDGLYNPIVDDPEIREDFFKSPLGQAMKDRMQVTNRGTSYAFMSHFEISRYMNIGGAEPRLLHFKYRMIYELIISKYVTGLDPVYYPYRGRKVYLKRDEVPGVAMPAISEGRYNELPEQYRNSDYFEMYDSFNFFWLKQRSFFRKFNMRDRDVTDADMIEMTSELVI